MSEKIYRASLKFAKAGHKPKEIWWGEVDAADITSKNDRDDFLTASLAMVVYKWLSDQETDGLYAHFEQSQGDDPGRGEYTEVKLAEEVIATFFLEFEVIPNPSPAEPLLTNADVDFLKDEMEKQAESN